MSLTYSTGETPALNDHVRGAGNAVAATVDGWVQTIYQPTGGRTPPPGPILTVLTLTDNTGTLVPVEALANEWAKV